MGKREHLDTIVAIATPLGKGGVGVVRLSGPQSYALANQVTKKDLKPRHAHLCSFYRQNLSLIDEGICLYFKGPHSFTGEDVVEFQGHGSKIALNQLVERLNELGARLAKPGEFSERAFLNGRLDLAQAEAIADLIEASSAQAARSAMRSLTGEFSKTIHQLTERVINLRIYVEAAIDFPEEEIDFLSSNEITSRMNEILSEMATIIKRAESGAMLREGLSIVIIGKPNVGKSSLLNQLAQNDLAIVTDIPGTTRDLIKADITIDGIPLHVIDTAGIRDALDVVEKEGIQRALSEIEKADKILWVKEVREEHNESLPPLLSELQQKYNNKIVHVFNKIDKIENAHQNSENHLYISAKTGQGIHELKQFLKRSVGCLDAEDAFFARKRHLIALKNAMDYAVKASKELSQRRGECVAEELRVVQHHLGEITGVVRTEDLLGRIFSSFCIGK